MYFKRSYNIGITSSEIFHLKKNHLPLLKQNDSSDRRRICMVEILVLIVANKKVLFTEETPS